MASWVDAALSFSCLYGLRAFAAVFDSWTERITKKNYKLQLEQHTPNSPVF